ncbi:hypothetical protein SAMN02746041_00042 [Desulfacinum hydrothermale DSM 13146]|uniref:Zinc resistance-associated protein n=1 Tax=Desulfacinum hydrothermale DSM 13146 TaxID=1121390 RepID=A0A1W1WXE8_9BACT|nr:hypothetical protein [Desulfacinum hydrothermale]SMC16277.1 hypothetical protein SAMN02746041_00042 [Desulfacinum hydrothermale DSM 13146]
MKKRVLGIALVVLVGLAVSSVWAWRGPGGGWGPCWTASNPQVQAFAQEVAPLRQDLYQKQQAYQQLLNTPDADPAEVGRLAQEINQLRRQIWEKARQSGMANGYGHGRRGGHGAGMGYGPCAYGWNGPPSQAQ